MEKTFINKCVLRGVVGNISTKETASGRTVANIFLMTSYSTRSSYDAHVTSTEESWHKVTAWAGPGIAAFDKIAPGGWIEVTGRYRTREFTRKDGTTGRVQELLAEQLRIITE